MLLQARAEEAGLGCGHPPVPAGGRYVNVTGGLGEDSWAVRYSCDTGEPSDTLQSCNYKGASRRFQPGEGPSSDYTTLPMDRLQL